MRLLRSARVHNPSTIKDQLYSVNLFIGSMLASRLFRHFPFAAFPVPTDSCRRVQVEPTVSCPQRDLQQTSHNSLV